MSVLDRNPTNINFLDPHNHQFVIRRLPNVKFFVQKINLPGLSLPPVNVNNPFSTIPHIGDQLTWNDLTVQFKVDEDLNNWQEIFNWLIAISAPNDFSEYNEISNACEMCGNGIYSDISLIILNNNKNPTREFTFRDCWPHSLSDIEFNTTDESINYVNCICTFKYISYKVSSL